MLILKSEVENHYGECSPTWLNRNQVCHRFDGGITGFFKNVKEVKFLFFKFKIKYGEEFHGIIQDDDDIVKEKNEY